MEPVPPANCTVDRWNRFCCIATSFLPRPLLLLLLSLLFRTLKGTCINQHQGRDQRTKCSTEDDSYDVFGADDSVILLLPLHHLLESLDRQGQTLREMEVCVRVYSLR